MNPIHMQINMVCGRLKKFKFKRYSPIIVVVYFRNFDKTDLLVLKLKIKSTLLYME